MFADHVDDDEEQNEGAMDDVIPKRTSM